MSKSNRRIRERRRARRQAAGAAPSGRDLIPHTRRCPCRQCEAGRLKALARAIGEQDKRLRWYEGGHVCPEHRDGWRISPNRSSDWMKMHEDKRDRRGHLTHCDMRAQWVAHLDHLILDQALDHLKECRPYWAWLVTAIVLDGHKQAVLARALGVHRATVGRHLGAALQYLAQWVEQATGGRGRATEDDEATGDSSAVGRPEQEEQCAMVVGKPRRARQAALGYRPAPGAVDEAAEGEQCAVAMG